MSDPHCGSRHGLATPQWWGNVADPAYEGRVELFEGFRNALEQVKAEKPIDVLIAMGDFADGQGRKSAGSEQTTTDWLEQIECAASIVEMVGAKRHVFITGTGYHVGDDCDYEALLAKRFNGTLARRLMLTLNGCVFDLRHHMGRSSIPYGMLSVSKDKMWNDLMAARGDEERANVVLRGHSHWFRYGGQDDWLAMSLPCLELPGTRYGARCSGDYTLGFVSFDIEEDGSYSWRLHQLKPAAAKVQRLSL